MLTSTLEHAIQKHQQGYLADARILYQQLLQREPSNINALKLLSLLAEQEGDLQAAIQLARQAIALNPNQAALYLALASPLLSDHQTAEAIEVLEKALRLDRRNIDLLLLMGDAQQQNKNFNAAIEFYHKALRLDKSVPETYNNLANALMQLGRHDEAIGHYQKAVSLKPGYADAFFNLGNALRTLGKLPEALSQYRETLRINPGFFRAYTMMGLVYKELGNRQDSEAFYQQALAIIPDQSPEKAITHYNLGNLYQACKKFDEAAAQYEASLAIQAKNPLALSYLANVSAEQGKVHKALKIYEDLAKQFPENPAYEINAALILPVIYEDLADVSRWRSHYESAVDCLLEKNLPPIKGNLLETIASTGFYLAYQGQNDKTLQQKVARIFRKVMGEPSLSLEAPSAAPKQKIKIGFISRHLSHQHTIGKLLQGIILNLSREQFEVVVFSVGSEHAYLKTGQEHSEDRFFELPAQQLNDALQTITDEKPDILFYTDIGMDTVTYLLAQHRLAPVQCTTWGHPVTTGIPTMDYFISTRWVEPEGSQDHYTETLVALENYPFYYYRPVLDAPTLGRADLGVETGQNLYVCPQSLFKFHPDTDGIFAQILRRDLEGVIILLSHPSMDCNQLFMDRIGKTYPDIVDRIRFAPRMPRDQFLSLLMIADVVLDSIHFSGGNTSYEALAFGTPIVTLNNPFMKGRLTVGLYRRMGMTDCIAETSEAYIDLAVHLGTVPVARAAMREKILSQCGVLYEDIAPVRELEQFFLQAIRERTQEVIPTYS